MLRPGKEFEWLFHQSEKPRRRILQIFLAGIILLQFYADLFNMADTYPTGRVMSASLIMGPVAGLLLAVFGAFFMMALGCLLDSGHRSSHQQLNWTPPLPLRFLWNRIFGRRKMKQVLEQGSLKPYHTAWNAVVNAFSRLAHRIGFGRSSYGQLFTATIRSTAPLILAAVVQLLEHIFADDSTFSASASSSSDIALLLKAIFIAYSFFLWIPLVRTAFQLSWPKAILTAAISVILSIGLVLLTMNTIFAVPLQ